MPDRTSVAGVGLRGAASVTHTHMPIKPERVKRNFSERVQGERNSLLCGRRAPSWLLLFRFPRIMLLRMRNLRQIIDGAGGPKRIAGASLNTKWPISAKSIYDWPQIGIPDRHWPILIELASATPEELYEANRSARARRRKAESRAA